MNSKAVEQRINDLAMRGVVEKKKRAKRKREEDEKKEEEMKKEEEAKSREGSPVASVPQGTAGEKAEDKKDEKERERSRRRQSRKRETSPGFSTGSTTPKATLEDMGGVSTILEQLNELVGFPLSHPELFQILGTEPVSGILLYGPPGCGKTRLCHAIAHALQVPFFAINGPEIISGVSGDSEARLRSIFTEASAAAPSLILLDEIDAIAGKREDAGKAMEARIVAQLQACMDNLATLWQTQHKAVIVLGATNRPEVIEPALRRSGRFDREISIGIPSLDDRRSILKVLTRGIRMASDVDLEELSFMTPGFVGADLHAVVKEAAMLCMKEIRSTILSAAVKEQQGKPLTDTIVKRVPIPESLDLESLAVVRQCHFNHAVMRVQPSSMREGFSTIPDVQWQDVGALEDVRKEMDLWVQKPIRHPELYTKMGLGQPAGLLLFGPPGCGKTLVAKAIAHEASANFISVKGPELLNKYVGESERGVRMVFARARASAPCVLFFDELDALAPKRGNDRSTPGAERLVNQLLTEMDGVEGRKQVYVIGATNRVDMIDPAMIRPGRFDKILYVPLPSTEQRISVLTTLCRRTPISPEVDLAKIATDPRCHNFSGADVKALVREAAMSTVQRVLDSPGFDMNAALVTAADFEHALDITKPSVSEKDRQHYDLMWSRRLAEKNSGKG
eukprot:TRINITY_DN7180_c0_g1_i1.p1 TRINITY_DN7180_c0_g1~~TRINITY_DN7180_c0_g1_i1.p1  ORF type:complete len:678 (+),score=137.97 TRINITY_DN7180_c0_g1_i1:536-2569(+)